MSSSLPWHPGMASTMLLHVNISASKFLLTFLFDYHLHTAMCIILKCTARKFLHLISTARLKPFRSKYGILTDYLSFPKGHRPHRPSSPEVSFAWF